MEKQSTVAMEPTYAEKLLYLAGFQFQPRSAGERLDIDRIADADIESIIRNVDIETLSSFLEDLAFCEITTDDLYQYSDRSLLKLFQLMQLCLEYLVDSQDTLSAHLNGLAKKYAAKKTENGILSEALKQNDLTIATLKDKLHRNQQLAKPCVSSGAPAANEAVGRTDPNLYPSQQRCQIEPTALKDISSESSTATTSQEERTVRLHVVYSAHALYLQLDVQDSLTVSNLKNKVVARLLSARNYSVDFEKSALFHKGQALTDPSQTLKECGVVNDAALVILPRPAETAPPPSLESKLEQLTSLSTKSHNELAQAVRTLALAQESSKASLVEAIAQQTKSLEGALREEVQRRVKDSLLGLSLQSQKALRQDDVQSPLSKLNVSELVETDGGENEDGSKESALKEDRSPDVEAKKPEDNSGDDQGKVDVPPNGVPLKVDTTAEVFDREVSPFNPPSEVLVLSNRGDLKTSEIEVLPLETSTKDATEESGTGSAASSTMTYSASSTQPPLSTRTPTPTKGHLDRKVPPQEEAPPATSSPYGEARQFRFSDASLHGGLADPETAPQITPGMPETASDMQSIEVPTDVYEAAGNGSDVKLDRKQKGRFGLKKRSVPSLKKIIKWKSSKSTEQTGEHVEI